MASQFLEILKYTLPSLILLVTVYFIIKRFINLDIEKRKIETFSENLKIITPLRLQAYERLILFLERITVESLALRLQTPGITARELQISMLENVRKEFNHNLSQQLYVSKKSWNAVKNAKEQIIRTINVAGTKMNPQLKGHEFTKTALDVYSENNTFPVEAAVEVLKSEASLTFGM